MASELNINDQYIEKVWNESSTLADISKNHDTKQGTKCLNTFFKDKTKHTDLVLVIEEEEIYVCKAVLSLASPVFDAMFESEFKEKSQDRIKLPEKNMDDFVEFLQSFYPNICKRVTEKNVYKIIPLADEYQVGSLKEICHELLLQKIDEDTNAEEVIRHLHLGEKYGMMKLLKVCILLASELPVKVMNTWMDIYPVSETTKNEIKDKALMRFELEIDDNDFVKDQMTEEFYTRLKARIYSLGFQSPIFAPNASLLALPKAKKGIPVKHAFQFGYNEPLSKTNNSVLRGLRLVYKYFQNDTGLKEIAVRQIRQSMKTFSKEDQEVFDLLPETVKHEIRGKRVWTIPEQTFR